MPPSTPIFSSFLLSLSIWATGLSTTLASPNVWHVSIWEAPAPPPGEGSPLQASALRNKSYLPAQIASIVAAYVLSLLLIGTALLFVGRRLRRAAQSSPTTLSMEMVQPAKTNVPKAFDPSPISPANSKKLYGPSPADTVDMRNNWPSPTKRRESSTWGSTKKGHSKRQPSIQSSVVSFDESVIADDKERNEREMERLYAAVVDHDERKSASVTELAGQKQGQNPPELQYLRDARPAIQSPPRSDAPSPTRTATKSPQSRHRPTPISLHSHNSSRSSLGSFTKKRGFRNLPISPPMGSPDIVPDHIYSEAEPLSPRIYDDPGPPPPTPPQRQAFGYREDRLSPRDARFSDYPPRTPRTSIPAIPAVQSIPETRAASIEPRNFPAQASARDPTKAKRTPAPLALKTPSSKALGAQVQTNNALRTAPLPFRNAYPGSLNSPRPDGNIQATVIETRPPGQSLRTPRTGVPMTPYSPYMPFTPLTPMTPSRLVTKEERKRKEKEEGRRVITVEDAVIEEADTWGDAYS